jgi:hypothetical protein
MLGRFLYTKFAEVHTMVARILFQESTIEKMLPSLSKMRGHYLYVNLVYNPDKIPSPRVTIVDPKEGPLYPHMSYIT